MATAWPSIEDKIQRAVIARLAAISTGGGFLLTMPMGNVVDHPVSLTWFQNHVPSAQVILGAERIDEEYIRAGDKSLDVHILLFSQDRDEPERTRERLIADVKEALYTPNRLDDPDSPGTPMHCILRGISVERYIGEKRERGDSAAEITAVYEYVERTAR